MDEKEIKFNIHTINVLGFSFDNPVEHIKTSETVPIEFKYGISYRWNIEKELFGVVFDFIYVITDTDPKFEVLKLKYITEFGVFDLKKYFTARGPDDFDMNKVLEITLVGMAYSTGRGILFEKSKGTFLVNNIVPPIPTNDLILSTKIKNAQG